MISNRISNPSVTSIPVLMFCELHFLLILVLAQMPEMLGSDWSSPISAIVCACNWLCWRCREAHLLWWSCVKTVFSTVAGSDPERANPFLSVFHMFHAPNLLATLADCSDRGHAAASHSLSCPSVQFLQHSTCSLVSSLLLDSTSPALSAALFNRSSLDYPNYTHHELQKPTTSTPTITSHFPHQSSRPERPACARLLASLIAFFSPEPPCPSQE